MERSDRPRRAEPDFPHQAWRMPAVRLVIRPRPVSASERTADAHSETSLYARYKNLIQKTRMALAAVGREVGLLNRQRPCSKVRRGRGLTSGGEVRKGGESSPFQGEKETLCHAALRGKTHHVREIEQAESPTKLRL